MKTAIEAFEQARSAHNQRPHFDPRSFYCQKAKRTKQYFLHTYGWKLKACTACNGSGRYDHVGSPECGSCDGSGKEAFRGEKAWPVGTGIKL